MNLTKTEKITGVALVIVLLLLTLSGSGYFFFTLKVTFVQWLAYNACSPSSLVYLGCLIVSHITMTLNLIWAGYVLYRIGDYKAFAQGLLWSIVLFVPYIAFVMYYCRTHAEEISQLLEMV